MRLESPQSASRRRSAAAVAPVGAAPSPMSPDAVDLDSELSYWRANYRLLFGRPGLRFSDYEPAVKLGLDAYVRGQAEDWPELDEQLRDRYRRVHGASRLDWNDARAVAVAACERIQRERGQR